MERGEEKRGTEGKRGRRKGAEGKGENQRYTVEGKRGRRRGAERIRGRRKGA
jgi:hypothetical protein